jgi:signal transduction histidine kinase
MPEVMSRTLRRPLPRTPAQGPREDDALLALEAFDVGSALVDLTHRRLRWCSPGFAARCCVLADDPLELLEPHLPGVAAALAQLHRPAAYSASDAAPGAPRRRWHLVDASGPLVVQAVLVRAGLAALRVAAADDDGDAPLGAIGPGASEDRGPDDRHDAARRHLEDRERLLFTSRALAVGEMASTLSHELNQPIGTVTNVLRGLAMRLARADSGAAEPAADLQQGVQLALEQAQFAARVIARIREYTLSRQPRREPLDLGAVARGSVGLLDWEIRRDGVLLELAIAPEPCHVLGDEVMLEQVLVNLLRNALEAMRDNVSGPDGRAERRLHVGLAADGTRRQAVITVRDNGAGLPADADERLFAPFHSTKPNGMGIGLNICRSFVELHQGRLWFTPNAGAGASFHVALPLHTGVAP